MMAVCISSFTAHKSSRADFTPFRSTRTKTGLANRPPLTQGKDKIMITKSLVEEKDRLNFLPHYFGENYLRYELLVFLFADKFCDEYHGGYWDFYHLSNSCPLMVLSSESCHKVVNDMNFFTDAMSSEAMSVGVNIFAMYALLEETRDSDLIHYYRTLKEFASEHIEASKIMRFID